MKRHFNRLESGVYFKKIGSEIYFRFVDVKRNLFLKKFSGQRDIGYPIFV